MRKYLFPIWIMCAALVSCSDKGKEEPIVSYEVISAPSVTSVADISSNTHVTFTGASYKIAFDDTKKTATIDMANLRYDNGSAVSYRFSNVPFSVDAAKSRVISMPRITPDKASSPVFTDLKIIVLDKKEIDLNGDATKPVEMQGVAVAFTVDGKFKVVNLPYKTVFTGTTTTVNNTSQSSFVSTKSTYVVEVDFVRRKAVMKINDPSFDANMPSLGTMVFGSAEDGIDVALTAQGFRLSCASLIPSIAGTPYPRFSISDLEMDAVPGGESRLKFGCMIYKVTADFGVAYTE